MLSDCIKETWGGAYPEIEVFYLWAKNRKKREKNDVILNVEAGYGAMLPSIVNFFKKTYCMPYDYVMKTNTGSYIDGRRLVQYLSNKPRLGFYCGVQGDCYDHPTQKNINFVSGSGIILSWDLAKLMVDKPEMVNYSHIDDVAIGQFMQDNGVEISKGVRLTYHGEGKILQIGAEVIAEQYFDYNSVYHYRLRSDDGKRVADCDRMRELHEKLKQ
jgi:hypothetical protein